MPTFKITLEYDGTSFVGWQRQAAGASIQGLVEDALRKIEGRAVDVAGAGRTDAGVHALGQTASFTLAREMDVATLARALNGNLPHEVRVRAAEVRPEGFHARFNATQKTYRYRIWNTPTLNPFERLYTWHVHAPLDVDRMNEAAQALIGRHDFAAFQSLGATPRTTERTLAASAVRRDGALVFYEVTGNGFLHHMVRAITGTLVEIGLGRWPAARMPEVLASRARGEAGPTAPPQGLFLVSVEYADL